MPIVNWKLKVSGKEKKNKNTQHLWEKYKGKIMTIRERDRVKMTQKALDQGLHKPGYLPIEPSFTGTVISVLPSGSLRILRDRRKDIVRYHPSFWEKLDE